MGIVASGASCRAPRSPPEAPTGRVY